MSESPLYDELKAEAIAAIRRSTFAEHAAVLESWIAPAIGIGVGNKVDDGEIEVGASKTGGQPDFPPNFAWPYWQDEPLTFIAQFNLAEIAPFDVEQVLPKSGLLSFWSVLRPVEYDNFKTDTSDMHGRIGNYPNTSGAWRVIYLPDGADLQRTKEPVDIPHFAYAPCPVTKIQTWISFADSSLVEVSQFLDELDREAAENEDEEYDAYEDFYDLLDETMHLTAKGNCWLHLLGYAHPLQGDNRYSCEKVSSGFAYDAELSPQQEACMEKDAQRWRLLMQIGSDNDMTWAGFDSYAYFLIPSDDLKARRWEKAWFDVQR